MRKTIGVILCCVLLVLFSCTEREQPLERFSLAGDDWFFSSPDNALSYRVSVPGNVYRDLRSHGLLADSFLHCSLDSLTWYARQDWEYKRHFQLGKKYLTRDHIILVFEGLDTYADVYLNDSLILSADNMFRRWSVDCKPFLKKGNNTLRVYFHAPIKQANASRISSDMKPNCPGEYDTLINALQAGWLRKAYDPDWMLYPQLISAGIWRDVYLEAWDLIVIDEVVPHLDSLDISDRSAHYTFRAGLSSEKSCEVDIQLMVNNQAYSRSVYTLSKGRNVLSVNWQVQNARLWWPNGMGEPYLYDIRMLILHADQVLDSAVFRLGIRDIQWPERNDPASIQKDLHTHLRINGEKLFLKGSYYVPGATPFVDSARYHQVMEASSHAHMNMLRVQGGAGYEHDYFYQLCDENGILVWQDFLLPDMQRKQSETLLNHLQHEITDQVSRLRTHPSVVCWGAGETQKMHYDSALHAQIAHWLAHLDKRLYIPANPTAAPSVSLSLGYDFLQNEIVSAKQADSSYYIAQGIFPNFSPCLYACHKKWFDERENVAVDSLSVLHPACSLHYSFLRRVMQRDYHVPDDWDDFLYLAEVIQAESVQHMLRFQRLASPACIGSIFGYAHDAFCLPSLSPSERDMVSFRQQKALYYTASRSYAPLVIIPIKNAGHVDVFLLNDYPTDTTLMLDISSMNFRGRVYRQKKLEVELKAHQMLKAISFPAHRYHPWLGQRTHILMLSFLQGDGIKSHQQMISFATPGELKLPDPEISYQIIRENEMTYTIEIVTRFLARHVFLSTSTPGSFSDNYFDMLPGEVRRITFHADTASGQISAFTMQTLADIF